jgi:hypothetical protein
MLIGALKIKGINEMTLDLFILRKKMKLHRILTIA